MPAPKGNQFWKLRSNHGRDKIFESPKLLWNAACEYFQWCDENPLKEEKLFHYQGNVVRDESAKMRAYTLNGLCLYLDCSENYFRNFESNNKNAEGFMAVIARIEKTIYNQKFTGAAAELLNPNIIARDLGLSDKKEHKVEDLREATDEELEIEFSELTEGTED